MIRKNWCRGETLVTRFSSRSNWFLAAVTDSPVSLTKSASGKATRPEVSRPSMKASADPSIRVLDLVCFIFFVCTL